MAFACAHLRYLHVFKVVSACFAACLLALVLGMAVPAHAFAWFNDVTDTYSATQDVPTVGDPIYAEEVPVGTYSITGMTSSYMCKISDITLTATGSELWVTFTISKAYNALYLGTAEEAASLTNEDGTDCSAYITTEPLEGYVPRQFSFVIPALNEPLTVATFSGGNKGIDKGMWYTRTFVFDSTDEILTAIANGGSGESGEGAGEGGSSEGGSGESGEGEGEGGSGGGSESGGDDSATPVYDQGSIVFNVGSPFQVGQASVSASLIVPYTDGTESDLTGSATWESTDESVFTVDASGNLTFLAEGEATLRAYVDGQQAGSETVEVEVASESAEPDYSKSAIKFSKSGPYEAEQEGVSVRLVVPYSDGTEKDRTSDAAWESADESVFTVDASGSLAFVGKGKATLTAFIDGKSVATAEVKVVPDGQGGSSGNGAGASESGTNASAGGSPAVGEVSTPTVSEVVSTAAPSKKGAVASEAKFARSISLVGSDVVALGDLPTEMASAKKSEESELDLTPFMMGGVGVTAVNLGLVGALLMAMRRARPNRFPKV